MRRRKGGIMLRLRAIDVGGEELRMMRGVSSRWQRLISHIVSKTTFRSALRTTFVRHSAHSPMT
jgi:hypothetical protein